MMTSRREFLVKGFGTAVITAFTWPIRAYQPRSAHGQSGAGAPQPGQSARKTPLRWEVFVTPSIPVITSDFAPSEKERPWPPISSTLIYGERDAVLVDAFITVEQSRALANWVAASGKNLTTIYATHGHGDHFFGARSCANKHRRNRSRRFGIRAFPARSPAIL